MALLAAARRCRQLSGAGLRGNGGADGGREWADLPRADRIRWGTTAVGELRGGKGIHGGAAAAFAQFLTGEKQEERRRIR